MIRLKAQPLEVVGNFKYLGREIANDGTIRRGKSQRIQQPNGF